MSGATQQPTSGRDQHRSARGRWYLAPLILLILAILSGDVLGLADGLDDSVSNSAVRDSVRVPGTVTAIQVRDDFVHPSVIDVTLQREVEGRRTLAISTTDEGSYSVGERVPVEVDVRHVELSAIAGDEEGPNWTLGVEMFSIAATVLLSISSLITAIVSGTTARGRRRPGPTFPAPPWATAAPPAAAPAVLRPVPVGSAPRLEATDPELRRAIDAWCRGALVGSVLRVAAAVAGIASYVWSGSVHSALARDIWHLVAFLLVAGSGPVTRRALLGRRAMRRWVTAPGAWRPASAQLVRSRWQSGLMVASDTADVRVYSYGLDPVRPFLTSPTPEGFPVWVSAGRDGSLAVSDGGGLIAAWPARGNPRWRPVGQPRRRWKLPGR